jgi:hypothetical protein
VIFWEKSMRLPIAEYCKQQVKGWSPVSPKICLAPPGEVPFFCSFINEQNGIHMMASIRDYGKLQYIHVSIAPIRFFLPNKTNQEHQNLILDSAFEIIKIFLEKENLLNNQMICEDQK